MYMDALLLLDEDLALSGATTTEGTNSIDLWRAKPANPTQDLNFFCLARNAGGTTPQIRFELWHHDVDGSGNVINASKLVSSANTLMSANTSYPFYLRLPPFMWKRYVEARYTLSGTSPTCTVTCGLVLGSEQAMSGK